MIVSRSQLTKCRDLRRVSAQTRCTFTKPITTLASTERIDRQGDLYARNSHDNHGHVIENNLIPLRSISALSKVSFSTTSQYFLLPDKSQRKFLEPRNKPTFRKRTREEKELFLTALRNAREERDQKEAQRRIDEFHSTDADLKQGYNDCAASTDTSSSFAFSPSHRPNAGFERTHNSSRKQDLTIPTGFPPLASVARRRASTRDLENELHYLAHNDPHPKAIYNLLWILVHDRKIKPGPQHYEALILANCWPEYGSVENVKGILIEMEKEGVEVGAGIISAVLKVLAIRPSPELSHAMLSSVDRQWVQLSQQTQHHLILSTIRTGQVELASWMLDVLRSSNRRHGTVKFPDREIIPDYLVVLLIVELIKIGDWEEVLRYMYKLRERRAADREIPPEFWGWVLERASKAARIAVEEQEKQNRPELEATDSIRNTDHAAEIETTPSISLTPSAPQHLVEYIWRLYVEPKSIRPSWTTCLDIQHVACRTGKTWLYSSTSAVMSYMHGVTGPDTSQSQSPSTTTTTTDTTITTTTTTTNSALQPKHLKSHTRGEEDKDGDQEWWNETFLLLDPTPSTSSPPSPKKPTDPGERMSQMTPKDHQILHPSRGNLWPIFPSFDLRRRDGGDGGGDRGSGRGGGGGGDGRTKIDSAHVDAWTALGPKSSARGKWTEAQRFYREREKMEKGEEKKRNRRKRVDVMMMMMKSGGVVDGGRGGGES